jgi:hypothetical protein
MKFTSKMKKHLLIFLSFVLFYTAIYMFFCNHSLSDSLYIATSTGTFAGATIDIDKDRLTRNVCTIQLLTMYVTIIIILNIS